MFACQLKNDPSSTPKEIESNDQHGKQHEEVCEIIEFTAISTEKFIKHYVMSSSGVLIRVYIYSCVVAKEFLNY